MLNKIRNRKGFTLIELLIVVEIIGILASRIVAMSFCEPRSWTRVLSS